jgi:hypothetical protein
MGGVSAGAERRDFHRLAVVGLIKRWLNFGLAAIPGDSWTPLLIGSALVVGVS